MGDFESRVAPGLLIVPAGAGRRRWLRWAREIPEGVLDAAMERRVRTDSQLRLANHAQDSQRHLSLLENGRSRPSPEMDEHLSILLGVPLRARNALLDAAGFADAYIVDRSWNLLDANSAAANLTAILLGDDTAFELATECTNYPGDSDMRDLYDEVTSYPDVGAQPRHASATSGLLTAIEIDTDGISLRLHTTISCLAATGDVTLEELRLETLLPADDRTAQALRLFAT